MKTYKLKGEMYVDTMINVLIICLVLTLCLSVLPILIYKYQLDVMASQISRNISVDGICGSEQIDNVKQSFGNAGVAADVKVVYRDMNGNEKILNVDENSKIQLADKFTVIVTYDLNVKLGGIAGRSVKLSANSTGRSEVYWKELAY